MHHFAANTHTYVNSWAPSHQTNSNMQKCPSGTTYKYHFPNTPGNCSRSLPYGAPRAGSALMLTTKTGKKNLPKKSLRQSGKFKTSIAIPTKQPLVPDNTQDNKFNKLPNDHPQASEGPVKTSALISTDQPHDCNIDEAPHDSFSQNPTRKVKDWRDWTYTDGSLQENKVGQDTGSGAYHPHFNVSHYVNPKGMGITNTISRA